MASQTDSTTCGAQHPGGRYQDIDFAKGIAAFLMILAHIGLRKYLPFGTFGAPLFFLCSGMNTALFIERNEGRRGFGFVHLFFPVLLFFGGVTQVAIAHGGKWRLLPEYLQVSALSMALIFLLWKIFGRMSRVGACFPLPFLLYMCLAKSVALAPTAGGLGLIIGQGGFTLLPWAGYFLFGVFLLDWRQRRAAVFVIASASGILMALSALFFRLPLRKFNLSPSYLLLSLAVLGFIFGLSRRVVMRRWGKRAALLIQGVSLVGRNSLMFIYLHYFIWSYFPLHRGAAGSLGLALADSAYAFAICALILWGYEKIKILPAFFVPSFGLMVLLAFMRRSGVLFGLRGAGRMADMFIGILFAFVYVQLRAVFRRRLVRGPIKGRT